jgi:hypothetical protein
MKSFTSHSNRLDMLEKLMQPRGTKIKIEGGLPPLGAAQSTPNEPPAPQEPVAESPSVAVKDRL